MTCLRCGIETPRLTLSQRRCPPCEAQVRAIVETDARRHVSRFRLPKSLDPYGHAT